MTRPFFLPQQFLRLNKTIFNILIPNLIITGNFLIYLSFVSLSVAQTSLEPNKNSNTSIDSSVYYAKQFKKYKKLAENGDINAMDSLGGMYFCGKGVTKSEEEGIRWTRKAAEKGHIISIRVMMLFYKFGIEGVLKIDKAEEVRWCQKGAELGDAISQYFLGLMYLNGDGLLKDAVEAARWYRKAAEQGNVHAQSALGLLYASGVGVSKDETTAADWYRKAAVQGDTSAQFRLGYMYANGVGVMKDAEVAISWYQKAAEQGNASAQYNLGFMYTNGYGVSKDPAKAAHWYQKAAEQGNFLGQYNLGVIYANGLGVLTNIAEAARWYQKAAEQGYAAAQYNLGFLYASGNGVSKNAAEAVRWYQKAAEQGNMYAQYELGGMYDRGEGVQKNATEAINWWRKAAEQGNASAQTDLGFSYAQGNGIKTDEAEAVHWWRIAAEQGNATAQFNLACCYISGKGGLLPSGAAAADWFYKAGLSYLNLNHREDALLCVERIQNLVKVLNLTVPNEYLAQKLMEKISTSDSVSVAGTIVENKQLSFGTGWIVTGGYIVTCYHVIERSNKIKILTYKGDSVDASVLSSDPVNDIVLLKVDVNKIPGPAIPLSTLASKKGESLFTIGFPHPDILGVEGKLSNGVLSSTTGIGGDVRIMQVTVPVQAGNSGGPLLNNKGEVIGIIVAKLNAVKVFNITGDLPENTNFAIKAAYLKPILESVTPSKNIPILTAMNLPLEDLSTKLIKSIVLIVAE